MAKKRNSRTKDELISYPDAVLDLADAIIRYRKAYPNGEFVLFTEAQELFEKLMDTDTPLEM